TDGTPHPYTGIIEPGADLSGANLSNADLSYAELRDTILRDANLSNANLSGASLFFAQLKNTNLRGVDFSGANLNNTMIGSEFLPNTIWTNVTQSEYDSVVAERDARQTQSAYDLVVNERDALQAKFGSNLIAVDNGVANVGVDIETSEDLNTWTTGGTASASVTIEEDAQFIRFKMTDDPDSLSEVYQLFHTQSWTQETGYKRVAHIKYPETDAQSYPVLILLHGAGSNAYSKINQYIDLNNYILVALQGYDNRWNIQTESTKADDLNYIENIINQLKTYSDVDASNISLLGSSNGAAMVNRAMIELPAGTFKNAITLASQLSTDQYRDNSFWGDDNNDGIFDTEYTLSQDLRVLSLHGTNDTTIPYDGGYVNFIKRTFIEARESNLILARALGYSGDLATGTTPFIEKPEIVKYEYLGGDAEHYQFIDGNHGIGGFKEEINTIIEDFISDN
ncbi:MAG: pentapeptide repeat-containing protein, partial [Verrucomicrobiota bacterium]|nr:pentapeptide repeat-containing protein [Verrucomicrobiota bacterium]